MNSRYRLNRQPKSFYIFCLKVSLYLWTMLTALTYLNQSKGVYLAKICIGAVESITLVDREGQTSKSKTWCLDCIVQFFMADPSFSVADLILNEHQAACKAIKADSGQPQAVQYYFQTGPPKIV